MAQWVYFLDLVNDPQIFVEYDEWHTRVWPEVLEHLRASGFESCRIYRAGNRLVMIVESEVQVASDGGGAPVPAKVTEWEEMMDPFQVALPWADGGKWTLGSCVFDLYG
ncbi:L-rhamnose mutarotase [soil metagenome]